jgi:spore coat protein CotF
MTQVDQDLTKVNVFDLVDSVISTIMLIKKRGASQN